MLSPINSIIDTPRTQLHCCELPLLHAAIEGEDVLAHHLNAVLVPNWSEFGNVMFHFALERVQPDPSLAQWYGYLPVNKQDRCLMGTCGFKGAPDEEGVVEIGYEIAAPYRNQGFATELATALVQHAFGTGKVTKVLAHTLPEPNASTRVLQKCGFTFAGTVDDPDDGPVWRWVLEK
jgi:RimJ/RimL family protein N-acetyltransferase